jgi:hypothetical protein
MTGLTRPSATILLVGACLVLGCGGRAQAGVQEGNSDGQGGRGGQGERGGEGGAGAGPATHVTECEALCARTTEAGCSAGDSACVMVCATVTGYPACQSQIQAWLNCARAADVVCDSSGVPTFSGCDMQLSLAAACAATAPAPKVVQASCASYCEQIEAAGCTATTPIGECRQSCGLAGTVVSSCQSQFIAYVNCAVDSGESCDGNGQLNAAVCTAQQFAYSGCVLSAVGQASVLAGSGGTTAE